MRQTLGDKTYYLIKILGDSIENGFYIRRKRHLNSDPKYNS